MRSPARRRLPGIRTNQTDQDSLLSWGGEKRTCGRPRGRRVDSSPRRSAWDCTQVGSPQRLPRFAEMPAAASSCAVSGSPAGASQFDSRRIGQAVSSRGSGSRLQLPAPKRTPAPLLRSLRQLGSQRIALHVAADGEEMLVVRNRNALEASLIDVCDPHSDLPQPLLRNGKSEKTQKHATSFRRPRISERLDWLQCVILGFRSYRTEIHKRKGDLLPQQTNGTVPAAH